MRNFVASDPAAAEFVRVAPTLPLDKAAREIFVARSFGEALRQRFPERTWTDLESVEPGRDPPDVTGKENDQSFGLEVGEIKHGERAAGVDKLCEFRRHLADRLGTVRPRFKAAVFRVSFIDPLLDRQQLPTAAELVRLAETVVDLLEKACAGSVTLPPPLFAIQKAGTAGANDPRRAHPDDPVILFDADAVAMTPAVADQVVSRLARKKLLVSTTAGRAYLLLWSCSTELSVLFPVSCAAVDSILKSQATIPYDEVFLYDMHHVDRKAMGFVINPKHRTR